MYLAADFWEYLAGFEERKDYAVEMNRVIAGRYQIVEFFFGERTITLKWIGDTFGRHQIVEFLGAA